MMTLNLISDEQRAAVAEIRIFAHIKLGGLLIGITILLAGGFLFALQMTLNSRLTEIQGSIATLEAELPRRGGNSLDQNIRLLNQQVDRLTDLSALRVPVSRVANDIAGTVSPGITLTTFSIQPITKQLSLSGVARTRNDLLAFQNALKGLPYIESVETPLSTLTQPEDIEFSFSSVLLIEKIITPTQ